MKEHHRDTLRGARLARQALLAVGLACMPIRAASADDAPPRAPNCAAHVVEAARLAGLPAPWVEQVMRAESAGRVGAVSRAGAMGCMQIMPGTWRELTARHALGSDPFEPRANMIGGALYLRAMHDRFGWPGALAAYNAGPGRYTEHLSGARSLPAETRAYVARIAGTDTLDGRMLADLRPAVQAFDWRSSAMFAVLDEHPGDSAEERPLDATTSPRSADQVQVDGQSTATAGPAATLFAVSRP